MKELNRDRDPWVSLGVISLTWFQMQISISQPSSLCAIKIVTYGLPPRLVSCVLRTNFSANWRNGLLHAHSCTHAHTNREGPSCSFDAPPAKWSCCFLAPVTTATDCITSTQQRGTARWKRETISPSFHLLTSVIAVAPFLLSSAPLLRPPHSAFHVPITTIPFHQKPHKWKREKNLTDLVFGI